MYLIWLTWQSGLQTDYAAFAFKAKSICENLTIWSNFCCLVYQKLRPHSSECRVTKCSPNFLVNRRSPWSGKFPSGTAPPGSVIANTNWQESAMYPIHFRISRAEKWPTEWSDCLTNLDTLKGNAPALRNGTSSLFCVGARWKMVTF